MGARRHGVTRLVVCVCVCVCVCACVYACACVRIIHDRVCIYKHVRLRVCVFAPLPHACDAQAELVLALLRMGADATIQDHSGSTALDRAILCALNPRVPVRTKSARPCAH